jgi:hypothetical protein
MELGQGWKAPNPLHHGRAKSRLSTSWCSNNAAEAGERSLSNGVLTGVNIASALSRCSEKRPDVDGRDKPGHDD